jgi:hypothetical protein
MSHCQELETTQVRPWVLVREMRGAVDRLLEEHIDKPATEGEPSLSSSPVVRALLELLGSEGF